MNRFAYEDLSVGQTAEWFMERLPHLCTVV